MEEPEIGNAGRYPWRNTGEGGVKIAQEPEHLFSRS